MRRAVSRSEVERLGLTRLELAVILGIIVVLILLLWPTTPRKDGSHVKMRCRHNLQGIGYALRNYEELFGVLPPAYTVDEEGKPLHSWRTLILPYLGEDKRYELIDLTKPWNDPVNSAVSERIPEVYQCPGIKHPTNRTMYLGVFGKDKCFSGSEGRMLEEITDKHAETIIVIEVPEDQGVPWMAPLDADEKLILTYDAKTKWPHPKVRNILFVDGNAINLLGATKPEELPRMLTIAGGD